MWRDLFVAQYWPIESKQCCTISTARFPVCVAVIICQILRISRCRQLPSLCVLLQALLIDAVIVDLQILHTNSPHHPQGFYFFCEFNVLQFINFQRSISLIINSCGTRRNIVIIICNIIATANSVRSTSLKDAINFGVYFITGISRISPRKMLPLLFFDYYLDSLATI